MAKRCPCGKKKHFTYSAALRAALHSSSKFGKSLRIYLCAMSGSYHMTTQPYREVRRAS